MNKFDNKLGFQPWEIVVYVLVTIPLLIVGALLWLFGIVLRLLVLFRKRDAHG